KIVIFRCAPANSIRALGHQQPTCRAPLLRGPIRMHCGLAVRGKARCPQLRNYDITLLGEQTTRRQARTPGRARRRDDAPIITDLQRSFLSASEVAEERASTPSESGSLSSVG